MSRESDESGHADQAVLRSALGRREGQLRTFLENIDDGVFIIDRQRRFTFVNEHIARNSGFPAAAFAGMDPLALIVPEVRDSVRDSFDRVIAGEKVPPFELAYRTADGTVMWTEVNARALEEDGEIVGVLAISRNLQRRKAMEEALKESEAKYRTLVETMPNALVIIQDGSVVFANRAAEGLGGVSEVIGMPWTRQMALITPAERDRISAIYQRRMAGDPGAPAQHRTRLRRKDGTEVPIEIHVQEVLYKGRPAYQYVVTDVSEREQLEARVRHSHKMEAIGTLAGGIAHDFNNLLSGVLGMANLLRSTHEPGTDVYDAAAVIERSAERATQLTQQLLGFARRGSVELKPVDLHEVVCDVLDILRRTIDKRIELISRLSAPRSIVRGDAAQLQQVMMNLAVNARDAMPEGGRLIVETRLLDPAEPIALEDDLHGEGYLVLVVRDTGVGIPAEIRERIFEPFFTTKGPGAGSGMGLAVLYGIVRDHAGAVRVASVPGNGAEFSVYLPLADSQPEEIRRPQELAGRRSGTVLLVDDEELVRQTATLMLQSLGYEVVAAASGAEAIERLRELPSPVQLAIVDLSMPGMDGRTCLAKLREVDPELRALLTSGFALDGSSPDEVDDPLTVFLPKPYVRDQLAVAISAL